MTVLFFWKSVITFRYYRHVMWAHHQPGAHQRRATHRIRISFFSHHLPFFFFRKVVFTRTTSHGTLCCTYITINYRQINIRLRLTLPHTCTLQDYLSTPRHVDLLSITGAKRCYVHSYFLLVTLHNYIFCFRNTRQQQRKPPHDTSATAKPVFEPSRQLKLFGVPHAKNENKK